MSEEQTTNPMQSPAVAPDIDAILSSPEHRQHLLSHPEIEKEIQRQQLEGGRKAKAELAAYQQQVQAWYRDQQVARLRNLDDDEAGQIYKNQLAEQERANQLRRLHEQAGQQAAIQFVQAMSERAEKHLTPQERADLEWTKFNDPAEYIDKLLEVLPKKQAEKLAREMSQAKADPAKRTYTSKEIDAMSLDEYRQNAVDIDAAAREGRIR